MDARKRRARKELASGVLRAAFAVGKLELQNGQLLESIVTIAKRRAPVFARDFTFAELLEWSATQYGERTCLEYGQDRYSFAELNRASNRVARALKKAGVGTGVGVALMLSNHPRFLTGFFAVQKLGAYAVPVNTGLVGEGLAYILDHSESQFALVDHETADKLSGVREKLPRLRSVWVNDAEADAGYTLPAKMLPFSELEHASEYDALNIGERPHDDTPSLLLYTSGTTGLPKAVVSQYGNQRVKPIGLLANLLFTPDDKIYTCLPLFHANALILSVMQGLWAGIPLYLSKRFSASKFWQEVASCGATQLNTVGSMIPILLKTPPGLYDRAHRVRRIVSAACPKDAWEPFEQRFGVVLWEGYGAVDGGGVTIFNMGDAPIGSIGRPAKVVTWRLAKEDGSSADVGEAGELRVFVGDKKQSHVPYWRNEKAANEKVKDGWLHTGDIMQRDVAGYLYFVGRNTDSMRRRGENVSAYEIEKVVDSHPDVLESAAFGVPSPLGEQDIMVSIVPVEGRHIDAAELHAYLVSRLPKYAVPSYLDVVDTLPKTGTHRVIKARLKERGVSAQTIQLGA
ncbi:MAG: hypothetical protein RL701_6146 [Pseudomonadota bacterium]